MSETFQLGNGPVNRVRRVLYDGDPKPEDYRAAREEVAAIRDELSRLRGRLHEVGRMETYFWFDSTCNDAAGAVSCAIVNLYRLMDGDLHDLNLKANRIQETWEDAAANPDAYLIQEGTSRDAMRRG